MQNDQMEDCPIWCRTASNFDQLAAGAHQLADDRHLRSVENVSKLETLLKMDQFHQVFYI